MRGSQREPSWFEVTWNTARLYLLRRLAAAPARTAATVAAICCAVLLGGWLAWDQSSGPPARTTASTARPAAADGQTGDQARLDPAQGEASVLEAPAARRLAADHRLMLTASARRQLTSGQVDRRLGAALGQLLGHHMIQVRSFAAPRAGDILRTMSIDCIDELRVRPGSPQTRAVLNLLSKQPAGLRPASAHLTGTGKSAAIVVAYAPPSG